MSDRAASTTLAGPPGFDHSSGCLSDTVCKASYTPMHLNGYIGMRTVGKNKNYFRDQYCDSIKYTPKETHRQIVHSEVKLLPDDLQGMNDFLRSTGYGHLVVGKEADIDTIDFETMSDWYRFTGSSVWLPKGQCHLLASRIVYSPNKSPMVSFLRLQVFNSDWEEMKGRRLRYLDVSGADIRRALNNFSSSHDESSLDPVSIKFPSFMNIDMDEEGRDSFLLGPEDPRVFYRSTGKVHEPVVIFNQDSQGGRAMHFTFPLQSDPPNSKKTTIQVRTALMGENTFEKNWTPFFDTLDPEPTGNLRGSVYLLYDLNPLRVYKCSMDTGDCYIVQQDGEAANNPRDGPLSAVRGATSLKAVPRRVVQRMLRREGIMDPNYPLQMWVGFVKTHLDDCGCGPMFYRPTMMVLVKQGHSFRIDLLTDSIDFDLDVISWKDSKSTFCEDGNNVLNPNEISFWEIGEEGPLDGTVFDLNSRQLPSYEDYMALTISQADETVQVVFLRNVLNFVIGSYQHGNLVLSKRDVQYDVKLRTKKVETCLLRASLRYCEIYSVSHKRPPPEKVD
ncbi:DEKNAAC103643 [Brettanomyces naardenensis]|uniref:DEKNAAC103643 n=1 Tax=Brettanomyces naardenensis TaxID=13370 RepID=A0A448YNQ0_BRENA|nr:DEKNAAC103643 [Brettanomyces naardenensis]